MKIGYARVSTTDQTLAPQTDVLTEARCEKLFTDIASGARTHRPGLDKAVEFCREGDTLVVWKLDRMGRSMSHLIEIIQQLETRGVGFQSLTENIDTATPGGRLIFHLFGALAEFERDLIRERVQAGLKSARARGRKGGRPPVPEEIQSMAKALIADKSLSVKQICDRLGIAKSTFNNMLVLIHNPPYLFHWVSSKTDQNAVGSEKPLLGKVGVAARNKIGPGSE
jgi:DNA invertase Pin-like site-specific DNA recombinase